MTDDDQLKRFYNYISSARLVVEKSSSDGRAALRLCEDLAGEPFGQTGSAPVDKPLTGQPELCGHQHFHAFGHFTCSRPKEHEGRHRGDAAEWDDPIEVPE